VSEASVGDVRAGFVLIFKNEAIGERWVALRSVVAVTDYPGHPQRCGVTTAHPEGWIAEMPGNALRLLVDEAMQKGRAR
jgi:hypothetical protein